VLRIVGRFPRPAPIEWICLGGGVFFTIHYAWFLDDAFVYFRYVDNALFLGRGLVYNAGEYVEGFSSPLWSLLLLILRATGLNYWILTRVVGVLCFVIFWCLMVILNRRLSPEKVPTLNIPLCYLSLNYAVLCYFTSGVEAPLVQVSAVLFALFFVDPTSRGKQIALAVTPLVRHEFALPFALAWLVAWRRQGRFPVAMTLAGLGITGAWLLFRVYYYADLFPCTFYLKNTVDIGQGIRYLWDTVRPYWFLGFVAVMSALLLAVRYRPRRDGKQPSAGDLQLSVRLLMLTAAGLVAWFVVKIGGDPRHYRYLAFPFVLVVCASAGLAEHFLAGFPGRRVAGPVFVVALMVALVSATFYPRQLTRHPVFGHQDHRIVDRISEASLHRHHPTLAQPAWGSGETIELRDEYAAFRRENPGVPHTRIGVGYWCVSQYRAFPVRFVQSLGLTEPILARTEMPADRTAHKLGLKPLAEDLARVLSFVENRPAKGMYRRAVNAGVAAPWIAANLHTIEVIEAKTFNRHAWRENFRLAFTFPRRIRVPDE
jgi:hypothetical protein